MLMGALITATAMVIIAMCLNMYTLVKGPDTPDRILALDTMYINSIALIVLFGLIMGNSLYFEAALLIAMLGFVSTAALCKYVLRGDIIE